MDGNGLAGIVSFGTLLRRKTLAVTTKARSVMESPPEVDKDTPLTEVAEHMVSTGYRQLPVVKGHKIAGIISRMDIIRIISTAFSPTFPFINRLRILRNSGIYLRRTIASEKRP